jgi:phage shock protein PspC (stress-responsive transcriptional regulator)
MAEYFDIDPVLLRALFVASLIFGGTGIIVNVVFHFMTPER